MVPIPRDVALVVVGKDDEFGDDQYDEYSDPGEIDEETEVDEQPRTGVLPQPRLAICHDERCE